MVVLPHGFIVVCFKIRQDHLESIYQEGLLQLWRWTETKEPRKKSSQLPQDMAMNASRYGYECPCRAMSLLLQNECAMMVVGLGLGTADTVLPSCRFYYELVVSWLIHVFIFPFVCLSVVWLSCFPVCLAVFYRLMLTKTPRSLFIYSCLLLLKEMFCFTP